VRVVFAVQGGVEATVTLDRSVVKAGRVKPKFLGQLGAKHLGFFVRQICH
jgi:hypothetical protein